jgi:aerobic carbon-monoxide dehydrogenase small subunit
MRVAKDRNEPVETLRVRFKVNGRGFDRVVPANRVLADVLRDDLALTGTKIGCDQGVCGACTVLADGRPIAACATFAWQVDGARIATIEGLGKDGALDPVQAAFKERSAFQCGYCTPGLILSVKALLARQPKPDRATIQDWLGANICRCTGYLMLIEAVEDAARRLAEAKK